MKLLDTAPGRNRLAIASSIAVHLCALVALCLVPVPRVAKSDAPPTGLVVHIVKRAAPGPPARPVSDRRTAPPALAPPPVRRLAFVAAVRVPPRPAVRAGTLLAAGTRLRVVDRPLTAVLTTGTSDADAAGARPPAAAAPAAAPAATDAAPPPTAAPAASAPAKAGGVSGGGGGASTGNRGLFSASYPPAPAQRGALDAIRATLPTRARVRITVDENGRAAVVDWLTPPPDAALADTIRAKLMALAYIPAECDGLPCTGIISLTT
jgi:hypothetical protein